MAHENRYQAYYKAIENELDRRGLDYEIHGLPGADDIIHFEEYWVTNLSDGTKLFPAIADADEVPDLDKKIVAAVMAHANTDDTTAYYVILCGNGWSVEHVEEIASRVAARMPSSIPVIIETVDQFPARFHPG